MSRFMARNLVHLLAGNVVIFIPFLIPKIHALVLSIFFIVVNYLMSPLGPIKKLRIDSLAEGHPLGTTYYSISLTVSIALFYEYPWLLIFAFYPLVYGDAFSAIIGKKFGKHPLVILGKKKSIEGTIAFFLSTLFATFIFGFVFMSWQSWLYLLCISLLLAFVGAMTELLTPGNIDNLTIVFVNCIILLLLNPEIVLHYMTFI